MSSHTDDRRWTYGVGRNAFRRSRLPRATLYYPSQGVSLIGAGTWRSARCPFHDDNHPSLRVNVDTGAFRCMACGAHGGDVLAFHRLRYGLGFIEAAKVLNAWDASQ
jgi:hypothetical protein